jgi:D-serine deaminase-like pyridoxal phosphate-dependent protein
VTTRMPARGTRLGELETPRLLVERDVLEKNIADLAEFSREAGLALRPHFKTHRCPEIARLQVQAGAVGGTVAKTAEAEVFARGGVHDLVLATPVVDPKKIDRLLALGATVRIAAIVESETGVRAWAQRAREAGKRAAVMVEVDVGHHRTGVAPGLGVTDLARRIVDEPSLEFRGLLTHAGHSYAVASPGELREIGRAEGAILAAAAGALREARIPCPVVSVGSTPTVRVAGRVAGVTEVRPGNYVFHDRIQLRLGVVTEERCALSVLATVVARPVPERVVLDAGSKVLSSDRGVGAGRVPGFGAVLGAPDHILERLSEEHGILRVPSGAPYRIGDRVRILPNHACVTTNLHDELVVVHGPAVEAVWRIEARGCSL